MHQASLAAEANHQMAVLECNIIVVCNCAGYNTTQEPKYMSGGHSQIVLNNEPHNMCQCQFLFPAILHRDVNSHSAGALEV